MLDDVYRVLKLSTGPEDHRETQCLFEGNHEEATQFYERLREQGDESGGAYLVISISGVPLYSCS